MRPIIGITAKLSHDDNIGIITNQGCRHQSWVLLSEDYVKSVEEIGGIPIIIPILGCHNIPLEIVTKLDGIIFSGGNDINPKYYNAEKEIDYTSLVEDLDEFEINLYKKILNETSMPILGICRGLQLMNVVHGGTLFQEMRMGTYEKHTYSKEPLSKNYIAHDVSILEDSLLFNIVKSKNILTNSFHHQSINELGKNLKINAISEDKIIEGIEGLDSRFLLGVQWHPEMLAPQDSINDTHSKNIFKCFINASLNYKKTKEA